LRQVLN